MLPALSAEQDDKKQVKSMMRNSIMVSAYVIFPMMVGLAVVAEALISIILTDKWLPCVPYLQIYCFSFAFYPVHTCNLQAINAMGRSDIFLKLEIIKKTISTIALIIAVFCFESPIAIAMTGIVTTFTSCFINAYPNKKLIEYSYFEQMKDIIPSFLMACLMGVIVLAVGELQAPTWLVFVIQILVGVVVYIILSIIIKPYAYKLVMPQLKALLSRKRGK